MVCVINFIICDDEDRYLEFMEKTITTYMMKNQLEYKIYKFRDYNEKFVKMVEAKQAFKIYILDIETPTRSGIDIARLIRNKDINSVIIFLTGHQELGEVVMKNDFLFLSFINKFDNCEKRLMKSLDNAIKILNYRKNIKFKDNGIIYTIALDDILYVTRDSVARKSILKTDYAEFRLNKNLNEVVEMLDNNFIQTHRACIVNKKRIASYSKSKRIIMFDNGETVDIISSRFEGKLI